MDVVAGQDQLADISCMSRASYQDRRRASTSRRAQTTNPRNYVVPEALPESKAGQHGKELVGLVWLRNLTPYRKGTGA